MFSNLTQLSILPKSCNWKKTAKSESKDSRYLSCTGFQRSFFVLLYFSPIQYFNIFIHFEQNLVVYGNLPHLSLRISIVPLPLENAP